MPSLHIESHQMTKKVEDHNLAVARVDDWFNNQNPETAEESAMIHLLYGFSLLAEAHRFRFCGLSICDRDTLRPSWAKIFQGISGFLKDGYVGRLDRKTCENYLQEVISENPQEACHES